MNDKIKGLVFTIVLSLIVLLIFFGEILKDPGNYYFSGDGDGFKSYYGAIYHLNYDNEAFRMNGMNYPFGESAFFAGCQPFIVNATKFCNSVAGTDFSVVGVINLFMIFSILIAAIFLFLIFDELHLPWWYSSIVAIGISILSPQIARMGGHFSLSYVFWIPLMIYLILKFDKKESVLWTIFIALVTISAGITHLYFVGFFGFMIGLYWGYRFLTLKKRGTKPALALLFLICQYILPVIIIQLLIKSTDSVADRTDFPFGFFEYRGHPVGVFLPNGRPYTFIREMIRAFDHINWEAIAFIGMAALCGFLVGLGFMIKRYIIGNKFYIVSDVPVLNVLFWSSVAALLFSFGFPFFGLEWLVDYIGPIKQLRALARFSWFFFYMVNIVVFYSVFKYSTKKEGFSIAKDFMILAVFFLLFDGYWNISLNSKNLQNRKPEYEDKQNTTETNNWVKKINFDDYQAILPLPYFHVGSENIWVESQESTQELAMYVSLKTDLPMTAVQLSRTSISQTYLNYKLVSEPLNNFEVLHYFPNQKPLLLLFNKKHYPNEDELRLIRSGDFIFANDRFELRKLPIEKLEQLPAEYKKEAVDKFRNSVLYERNSLLVTDTTAFFICNSFNGQTSEHSYEGKGALTFLPQKWNTILEDTLRNVEGGKKFIASFWIYNYMKDGNLRTNLEFIQSNSINDSTTNFIYTDVHRQIKAFDGDWVLIEFRFETKMPNERIKLSLRNTVLKNTTFILDELLIREERLNIYYSDNDILIWNGRKIK